MPTWSPRGYRSVHRLVTDVCQVGYNPTAWTGRLLKGLLELFDAKMAAVAWAHLPSAPGEFSRNDIEIQHGFTDEQRRLWSETYCGDQKAFESEYFRRVVNVRAQFVTVRRQDLMSDEEWYALPEINQVHRNLDIDANLASFFVVPSMQRLFGIGVHRRWGDPQFTREERRLLRVLHVELARAWRHVARPDEDDPAVSALPPRLRQILWLLCLGRSEKEIAQQLGLSPRTVHNQVTRLHHLLGVRSRGELLARAIRHGHVEPVSLPDASMNQFL